MAGTVRDPLLPTHWFNILHERPQYVASALPRSRLAGLEDMAGHGLQLQQPFSLARQSLNTADRFIPVLAATNLDQFPQGPGPAPQPHHVDDLTGCHPEELPGQALDLSGRPPR